MTNYNDYRLRVTPEIDYESFGLADVSTSGGGNNDGISLARKDISDCSGLPWIKVSKRMLLRSIQDSLKSLLGYSD